MLPLAPPAACPPFFEPDTVLAHIKFFAGCGPLLAEVLHFRPTSPSTVHVERQVVFLRCQPREGQRLFGIVMISCREEPVRHLPGNHAIVHSLLKAWLDIASDHRGRAIRRQFGQIFHNGGSGALHDKPPYVHNTSIGRI